MTLREKLNTINKPSLPKLEIGSAKTVNDYWNNFIEPHLPANIESVIKWHKLLKEYVNKPDTVLGFRTGNVAGHLRRGWGTITNDGYSFFYTDNYFSHYFYKMSYDGFVPTLDEFYSLMKSREFPVRFASPMGTKDEPWEKEYAAFNVNGKNPGLGIAGYKLAHILDAGKNYKINNISMGIAEICNKYFSLGEVSDWRLVYNPRRYCRENFKISEDNKAIAKKLAQACFLQMVHPMNYFISPKSKNQGKTYNIYNKGNNIAEDSNVLSFVRQKFHARYTQNGIDYFQEFLDSVLPFEDIVGEDGSTVLNAKYSSDDLIPLIRAISAEEQNKIVQPKTVKKDETQNINISSVTKKNCDKNSDDIVQKLLSYKSGMIAKGFSEKPLQYTNNYIEVLSYSHSNKWLDSKHSDMEKMWSIIYKPKQSFSMLNNWNKLVSSENVEITDIKKGQHIGKYAIRIRGMKKAPNDNIIKEILNYIFDE